MYTIVSEQPNGTMADTNAVPGQICTLLAVSLREDRMYSLGHLQSYPHLHCKRSCLSMFSQEYNNTSVTDSEMTFRKKARLCLHGYR